MKNKKKIIIKLDFLLRVDSNLSVRYIRKNTEQRAKGITIPLSFNNELLKVEAAYCIIDICPKRECKLVNPIIIFSLFRILTYGRWYKPASGLLMLFSVINKVEKSALKIII